jgi:purine-binding chemotaxis protein CheW
VAPATTDVPAAAAGPGQGPSAAAPGRWLRLSIERDHYAIELLRVQEVVRVTPVMAVRGAGAAVLGVMNLRGRIVPVFDFGRWLDVGSVEADEHARIVVVERDDELVGLLVTRVDDVFNLADGDAEPPYDAGPRKRRAMDRALLGIARPGQVPTVLLDANALFE